MFYGLEKEANQLLKAFSAQFGLDITRWDSHRLQYFTDAYPVFAFLVIWMDEFGLTDYVTHFDEILKAGVFAVAGYGILDENVDGESPSPVEILVAQSLLAEYETRALNVFGVTRQNLEIMNRMRMLFLDAEIREKQARYKTSPYQLDAPEQLGAKGANSVAPFMLSLEKAGKAHLINEYWQVFLLFGAAIQLMDDWIDLEMDLAHGHYSYLTLGCLEKAIKGDPKTMATQLRSDQDLIKATFLQGKKMIKQSRDILKKLKEPLLGKMVDITEYRFDSYFRMKLMLKDPA